jgi:hypothetical protein
MRTEDLIAISEAQTADIATTCVPPWWSGLARSTTCAPSRISARRCAGPDADAGGLRGRRTRQR